MDVLTTEYPIKTNPTWNITDSTKLQQYMDCPRSYFYNYVLGWRPDKPNNHLVFGSAVHEAMEHLLLHGYDTDSIVDAFNKFNVCYRMEFGEETDELFSPKTPARFIDCLLEYIQKYSTDFLKYEVLYTEIAGSVSLNGYYTLFFKMDTILKEISTGLKFSLEHKTKGGTFNRMWSGEFPLGVQVGTYTHALYCLYPPEEVKGVTINGLAFKKTKSHMFEFERLPIWKTLPQMQVWQSNCISWMRQLESDFKRLSASTLSEEVLTAFPLNPRSCTKYFGCPYHDYCLAWPNPLKNAYQPPMGFKEEFWNPMAGSHTHEMHFGAEGAKDGD